MKRFVLVLIVGAFLAACTRPSPEPPAQHQPLTGTPVTTAAPQQKQDEPGQKHRHALNLIGGEDYPGAEVALQQVVSAEPQAAEAWNDLSLVQAKLGRFRESAVSARKALALSPGFSFAEFNLGAALMQTSDGWRDAKPHLDASAAAQPDRPEPFYALGLWYKYGGDLGQAKSMLQKAANMRYGPAAGDLVSLDRHVAQASAVGQVVTRFSDAPVQVIWDLMQGYVQQGYTRRIERVIPVRLRHTGETSWAALLREESSSDRRTLLQFQVPTPMDDYLGSCAIPGDGPVDLRVVDSEAGEHVLVTVGGRTLVCGLQDRSVEALFTSSATVSAVSGGLMVDGALHRFVPEISRYLPATTAGQVESLITEIRKAGHKVDTDSAVWTALDLGKGGGPGFAVAWTEGVAFKPNGGSAAIYAFRQGTQKFRVMYPYPHAAGSVTVPGHVFLAVQTLQPGGPNGADVLVLEYDPATRGLQPVFSGGSDGAGFSENGVSTTFKRYRPQGGFDLIVTDYTWDESTYTFVPGKSRLLER